MKLKAIYENQDEIPEAFRDLFVEDKNGKWRLTVEGVKTDEDFAAVQRALTQEREAHKRSKGLLHDTEDVQDSHAVRDVVMASVHMALRPFGVELEQARKRWDESGTAARELSADDNRRAVAVAVRTAAAKLNILPGAVEDAVLLGERELAVDDNGGIVSKTGANAAGWLAEVQAKRPHWSPPSSGGGSNGGSWFKRGASIANPWTHEHWSITEQMRFTTEHGELKAHEFARKAGSRIGATEPPPPPRR